MNKIKYLLLVLILFTGCSKESEEYSDKVTIDLSLSQSLTRSAKATPPTGYKYRYKVEVYYNGTVYSKTASFDTKHSFSLVRGKSYDFLVWADLVPNTNTDATIDNIYKTTDGLTAITLVSGSYTGSSEERDAFCGKVNDLNINTDFALTIALTRPFARIEYMAKAKLDSDKDVSITYTSGFCDTYNLKTGIGSKSTQTITITYPQAKSGETLLAFDFLFVADAEAECPLIFDIKVGDIEKKGVTALIQSNRKTIITGDFSTNQP